jgi:hypothetical protein
VRAFLSPGERRLRATLNDAGLEVFEAFLEHLDAHLVPDEEPPPVTRYRQLSLREREESREWAEAVVGS